MKEGIFSALAFRVAEPTVPFDSRMQAGACFSIITPVHFPPGARVNRLHGRLPQLQTGEARRGSSRFPPRKRCLSRESAIF